MAKTVSEFIDIDVTEEDKIPIYGQYKWTVLEDGTKVGKREILNKRKLIKAAWRKAKAASKEFGGKTRDYIGESMRLTWEWAQGTIIIKPGEVTEATLYLNSLMEELNEAEKYVEGEKYVSLSEGSGASFEQKNIDVLRELIEKTRKKDGDEAIYKRIKESKFDLDRFKAMLKKLIVAVYDPDYSPAQGGSSQIFYNDLKEFERIITGETHAIGKSIADKYELTGITK